MYKDNLHFDYEELTIRYNDVYAGITLNKALLDAQNAWGNLEAIKEAHWLKMVIRDLMLNTDDHADLYSYGLDLVEIEYQLQKLWNFSLDANFHRSWEYPKCACPILDNRDMYPHGKVVSSECPVHNPPLTLLVD